ncbi:hypothetical protein [Streptomyces sp. NL15-2K]|uniref:hypothetical protein n=1 Tax=Streptomyces sp. NL15-2K TaxID=376149 RepID=UPI000F56EE4C|nr:MULTISPECIES: hypothetical protein [Actinomycetes]WKX12793.1 hypothetical protein Q4V64_36840 [Kutzneria buriramensis]GCB49952.1 hypothetical protein SNL152K_7295 [Streptomyces sp. NL15-2K]
MRKLASAIGAGVAGLALLGAAQGSAQAAPQAVPSCVVGEARYLVSMFVYITNNCSSTQQVKVKYTKGGVTVIPDVCHTVEPGQTVTTSTPVWIADRYVGLVSC